MQKGPGKHIKNRIIFLMIGIFCFGLIPLAIKLFNLQIIDYAYYQQKAVNQQTSDKLIEPVRGTIYDRNLKPLAKSATVETVFISPLDLKKNDEDAEKIANFLSETLGVSYDKVYSQTQKTNSQYEIIKKGVEKDTADLVRTFIDENDLRSISMEEGTKRYYPYGNFAANVLGFVGTDSQGLAGIEAMYDDELEGTAGRVIAVRNPAGDMPYQYEKYIEAEDGLSVVLTIDEVLQHFLEKNLEQAKEEYNLGQKATGIIMNVKTGEILAMAMKDDFDPNQPFEITDQEILDQIANAADSGQAAQIKKDYLESYVWRNNAISDAYEPGSVFKSFTASMALEEKIVTIDDHFYCGGSKQVGKWNIDCWKTAGHGDETFLQGLQNSCNVVFMTVAERIGSTLFYKYQTAFGFNEKTGINLPGEGTSILHSLNNLNAAELATSSFGQTFKVTPIQMVTAMCAIANGGTLYKPYVVKELLDKDGVVQKSYFPVAKRQVISKETSETMCMALESVVSKGTGKNAYIKGFSVAGKTGTSEKIDVKDENGNPDRTKRIASFCAFAPADDPQIACLVILDEPEDYKQGGGAIAAPTVKNILEDCLTYLGVEPQYTEEELKTLDVAVPDVVGKSVSDAKNRLTKTDMKVEVVGENDTVVMQLPAAGTGVQTGTKVLLITDTDYQKETVTVPDVTGMSAQQANKIITDAGLNVRITGVLTQKNSVIVETQSPAAGTEATIADVVTIELKGVSDLGE